MSSDGGEEGGTKGYSLTHYTLPTYTPLRDRQEREKEVLFEPLSIPGPD